MCMLQTDKLFYKLYSRKNSRIIAFIGSAFPVAEDGDMLTCRHVIEGIEDDEELVIFDNEIKQYVPVTNIILPKDKSLDMAFMPNCLNRKKAEFFPIMNPHTLKIGEDVYTYGHHKTNVSTESESAYFKGNIVSYTSFPDHTDYISIRVSYHFIEGMSGGVVLTYHNGVKLVGLAHNNSMSRIVAREILEYEDDNEKYRETISRMVEYGLAYHPSAILNFCDEVAISGIVCSDESTTSMAGFN